MTACMTALHGAWRVLQLCFLLKWQGQVSWKRQGVLCSPKGYRDVAAPEPTADLQDLPQVKPSDFLLLDEK